MIRRGHKSCSRECGYELARAARQAASPSYAVWHKRIKEARGPASDYRCVDCGEGAEDWSTVDPSSGDVRVRFQPRCLKCHRYYDGAVGEGNPRATLTDAKVKGAAGPAGAGTDVPAAGRRIRHQRRIRLGGRHWQDMAARRVISRSAAMRPHVAPGLSSATNDRISAFAAGTGAVPAEHLRGGPAVEFHEVALRSAAVQPGVTEVCG